MLLVLLQHKVLLLLELCQDYTKILHHLETPQAVQLAYSVEAIFSLECSSHALSQVLSATLWHLPSAHTCSGWLLPNHALPRFAYCVNN